MDHVKMPQMFYLPLCLMTAMLIRELSPQEAWAMIHQYANTLHILEACTPIWAWLRVHLLADAY